MKDLTTLSLTDLKALATEKSDALDAIFAVETPTDEQVEEARTLDSDLQEIEAQIETVETAAAEKADAFAAIKSRRTATAANEEPAEPAEPAEEEEPEEPAEEEQPVEEPAESVTAAAGLARRAARKAPRPKAPDAQPETPKVSILASANTAFTAGSALDMLQVGEGLVDKVRGMGTFTPSDDRRNVPLQKFPVAEFKFEVPDDLRSESTMESVMAAAEYARKESRLEGGSLVAAGGWCAPSENIYELCGGESLDGLYSLPEITVNRGGINFTKGPQFADFYGTAWVDGFGFKQTEAQAEAGTVKDCFTIECPEFTEVRMDAVGLCLKYPILTEATYPELVRRYSEGALTAHQHRMSMERLSRTIALSGAAKDASAAGLAMGSASDDALAALTLVANKRREEFRLGLNESLEVVLPFWVKDVYKDDIGRRQGVAAESVTDAQIAAIFAARNLAPQWVYGWQPLSGFTAPGLEYPDTYQVLMYPAGTFVAGTKDVISLSAVYDAASLSVNEYTGSFTEQGLLVAEMCHDSDLITLPICAAGRRGALDITCVAPTP